MATKKTTKKTTTKRQSNATKSKETPTPKVEATEVDKPDTETNGNPEVTQQENKVETKPLSGMVFVIPYLKKAAAGDELKYALRSIEHSFPEANVLVVGDKEDWFSDKVTHLEHTPESDNPQVDVAQKLLLVISSGAIDNDSFILSNDDIFLLGKVGLYDIEFDKAFGVIGKGTGAKGGKYNQNAENTRKALLAKDLPVHRYGTHTPIVLNQESLTEILADYNACEDGHLVTTLYYNTCNPDQRPVQVNGGKNDPILVSVYRSDVPKDVLETALTKRKFCNVNDAGWKAVKPFMEKFYPDKSKWEA